MSKKPIDLQAMFGDPNKKIDNRQELMGDDYATGFHIFGLPKTFLVEDFAQHFSDRVSQLDMDFPPTLCLQGKAILRSSSKDESAEDFEIETTLTEVIFKAPVDVDVVSKVLMESIQQGLADKGLPDPEDGYAMESVNADYAQSLATLMKSKNGPSPGPR